MPFCAPQRYVGNEANILRLGALTPSSVLPVTDKVIKVPSVRFGTGAVELEGAYTGAEEATYDVEVVDEIADEQVVTAVVSAGVGSGTITDIVAGGSPQTYTIELQNDGVPTLAAGVAFDNVRIVSRETGVAGNDLSLEIDQSPLVFTAQEFSLLEELAVGDGGPTNGRKGAAFDWDTKVLSSDNIIPLDAHRVAFAGDLSNIYLAYKQYDGTEWTYHFVPAIKRAVPKGTVVNFVTGGRTVTVLDLGVVQETITNVVTVYDLLNAIKTTSALLDVSGVVAYDRSPTGQASKELAARTDAHAEATSGSGSIYATGFADVFVNANAGTELVTAECIANSPQGHPLAQVGAERWRLTGSLSGDQGVIVTGVPYEQPQGKWGLTIPQKLPANFGIPTGRFTVTDVVYVSRDDSAKPPICVVAMGLGPAAVDQTIELEWTQRPSGVCLCDDMPVPRLSARCLGTTQTGGESVTYQDDTLALLEDLYDWYADIVRDHSYYTTDGTGVVRHFIVEPNEEMADGFTAEALKNIVGNFEATLAEVDPLDSTDPLRIAAFDAWTDAVDELKTDVSELVNGTTGVSAATLIGIAAENLADNDAVTWYHDGTGYKVRKAVNVGTLGFVDAAYTAGQTVSVKRAGVVGGQTALDFNSAYAPKNDGSGDWVTVADPDKLAGLTANPISTTELLVNAGMVGSGLTEVLLSERYAARMDHVLISGGISPLGKAEAGILQSGDGCWRDLGGDYWTVKGSVGGSYAPAFNDAVYYSSRATADGKKYFSTHEFAFKLNIKCPGLLVYGDRILLSIGGAGNPSTYQVGDTLTLPVIAAQPLQLAGGQNGNSLLDFYVSGSVDGAFPPYTYDPDSPAPYYQAGALTFLYEPGGIPNRKGDRWTFATEGGHYRWRKDGGAWVEDCPLPQISADPLPFDAGLTIRWVPGASPSFVTGDVHSFRALQPWAVSNVRRPTAAMWKWEGDSATLDVDAGAEVDVPGAVIARHTIPEGATITLEGGILAANEWTETLPWNESVIAAEFDTPHTARYLRLSLTDADGGGIGWAWAGVMLSTQLSADVDVRDSYKIESGNTGLDEGGRYFARAVSGEVTYTEAALTEEDTAGLRSWIRWAKQNNDEPVVVIPNILRPDEAALVRIAVDQLTWDELSKYNRTPGVRERRYSISIPLSGVWTAA